MNGGKKSLANHQKMPEEEEEKHKDHLPFTRQKLREIFRIVVIILLSQLVLVLIWR